MFRIMRVGTRVTQNSLGGFAARELKVHVGSTQLFLCRCAGILREQQTKTSGRGHFWLIDPVGGCGCETFGREVGILKVT